MNDYRLAVGAGGILAFCGAVVMLVVGHGRGRNVARPLALVESEPALSQPVPAPHLRTRAGEDAAPLPDAPSALDKPTPPEPPAPAPAPQLSAAGAKADAPRPAANVSPARKQQAPDPAAAEARAVAREALFFVGADPLAEAVWVDAINDPFRSAHERSDLIEDLNEEGFPDPKHPGEDDLPLIESRLALIEDLAPDAMDDVNAAAFAEAYKDLVNMHARASME